MGKYKNIVIVNQAVNYLTIGFCNAFKEQFDEVSLITGSIHSQGEELNKEIGITKINKYHAYPSWKKALSYFIACLIIWTLLLTKYRKYDVLFVSVPPMAYLLNLILPNRFSMVIWDVFPDALKITGVKENNLIYRTWANLNKKSFKKSYKLYTISNKLADLIEKYVERDKIIITPIWSIFQRNDKITKENNPFIKEHQLESKFVVQYSGNISIAHNVEIIIQLASLLKDDREIVFQIIGRGPRYPYIKKTVEKLNLPNCKILPFQTDEMFPYSLSATDLGVVILDEVFAKGSVPSKAYNLMSYGIPSLYFSSVESELYEYSIRYKNAECFNENEVEQAAEFIKKIKNDNTLWEMMSINSLKASVDYKRENADRFVNQYTKI